MGLPPGNPGSPGTSQPFGAPGKTVDCTPGTMVWILFWVSYQGMLTSQRRPEVHGEVRLHAPGILREGRSVPGAGVQHLQGGLDVFGRRAQQEIGDIMAGLGAIESVVPVGGIDVPLVDLQIAEVAAELERVLLVDLWRSCRTRARCCCTARWPGCCGRY